MVKHQRRSHRQGLNPSELDDCTSESDSGESPSTPRTMSASWPPPNAMPLMAAAGHPHHTLPRSQSFNDYNPHMSPYGHPAQHPVPQHRYSLSGGHPGAAGYPGAPAVETQPQHQHHMLQRAETMPSAHHPYYVTDHNNPGVATMNTATHHMQPQYHHAPMGRPAVERLPLDIPYTAPGLTASLQSSPSTFSSAGSGRSPASQDGPFYAHHQPTQAATYALAHAASPVEAHTPASMMAAAGYPGAPQHQQQHPSPQAPQGPQDPTVHQQPQPYYKTEPTQQQVHHHHQPTGPHHPQDEQQWYPAPPQYQAPVTVDVNPTIGQIPAFGSAGGFDPWAEKFEDPTIEMPSTRVADMQ